jgi:hypothetical protein
MIKNTALRCFFCPRFARFELGIYEKTLSALFTGQCQRLWRDVGEMPNRWHFESPKSPYRPSMDIDEKTLPAFSSYRPSMDIKKPHCCGFFWF